MDLESVKWFASLGVGGILAGMMFLAYRRDFLNWREKANEREDRLLTIIERNAAAQERLIVAAEKVEHAANNLIEHIGWQKAMRDLR
jgi:hypothetical protein